MPTKIKKAKIVDLWVLDLQNMLSLICNFKLIRRYSGGIIYFPCELGSRDCPAYT